MKFSKHIEGLWLSLMNGLNAFGASPASHQPGGMFDVTTAFPTLYQR